MSWTTIDSNSWSATYALQTGSGVVMRVEIYDNEATAVSITYIPSVKILGGCIVPTGGHKSEDSN